MVERSTVIGNGSPSSCQALKLILSRMVKNGTSSALGIVAFVIELDNHIKVFETIRTKPFCPPSQQFPMTPL